MKYDSMKWDHQLDLLGGFISKVLLSEPNKIHFLEHSVLCRIKVNILRCVYEIVNFWCWKDNPDFIYCVMEVVNFLLVVKF